MRILIGLLFITMLALSSCATIQKECCPAKDVVIVVPIGNNPSPIGINKGLLDEQHENDFWVDAEKFDELMKEEKVKDELKKQSEDAVKETDKALGI